MYHEPHWIATCTCTSVPGHRYRCTCALISWEEPKPDPERSTVSINKGNPGSVNYKVAADVRDEHSQHSGRAGGVLLRCSLCTCVCLSLSLPPTPLSGSRNLQSGDTILEPTFRGPNFFLINFFKTYQNILNGVQ